MYIYIYIYMHNISSKRVAQTRAAGSPKHKTLVIWGFGYDFTDYNFRKTLDLLKNTLPEG